MTKRGKLLLKISDVSAREILGVSYFFLENSDCIFGLVSKEGVLSWFNRGFEKESIRLGLNLMKFKFLTFSKGLVEFFQYGLAEKEGKRHSVSWTDSKGEHFFGEITFSFDRVSSFYLFQIFMGREYEVLSTSARQQFLSYSKILDIIPADIAIFDLEHKYLYINRSSLPNDEVRAFLLGKDDFDYCAYRNKSVQIAKKRREVFERVLSTKTMQTFEEQFVVATGVRHHLRNFFPIFDESGSVEFVIGYGIDITNLRLSEQKNFELFNALKSSRDGVAITDENGLYTYLNPAHVQMFNYEREEELKGFSWTKIYSEDEQDRIQAEVFPILMETGSWSGKTVGVGKNGETIYQQISLNLLPNRGLICICRDIGQEYAQSEEIRKLALVAEKANSVVLITDSSGRIEWVNESFERVTRFLLKEVVTLQPTDIFEFGEEVTEKYFKLLHTMEESEGFNGEVMMKRKCGEEKYFKIDASPIYGIEDKLTNIVVVLHDISAAKEVELRLTNLLKEEKVIGEMKSKFISLTSHEFRTPLTGIQVSKDILELTLKRDASGVYRSVSKHFSRISEQILRLEEILNKILLMGKIETQKMYFKPELGSLVKLIKYALQQEKLSGVEKSEQINLIIEGEEFEIEFDVKLMEHVVVNLIQNAIKYSKGAKNPQVFVRYVGEDVEVEVKDYGIGIPEEDQRYLFTPFFRASNAENIQGTGLGLV